MKASAIIVKLIQAPTVAFGVQTSQRALAADANSQGTAIITISPKTTPAVLARHASATRPRTRFDQEVVIPHVGHRRPNT